MSLEFNEWNSDRFPSDQSELDVNGERIDRHHPTQAIESIDPLDQPQQSENGNSPSADVAIHDEKSDGSSDSHPFEDSVEAAQQGPDPVHPLNWRDVCAFIVNKMIGTGIFLQPPAVLMLTGSKGEALGLWFIGFIYTVVSMLLYIEFSRKLPHTGGELIYLDETLPSPPMLAYTLYTFYFVFTYNTATNSMQFANQVLISANTHDTTFVPERRLLRFIAIVALSFFCLLHYFSGRAGRMLNQVLALFKVCLLLIVIVAGIVWASHHFEADWSQHETSTKRASASTSAFLLIIFSFTGWENATFVSGEISNHRILTKGFVIAVLTVGILYFLVNLVFLLAIPYHVIEKFNLSESFVPIFFGGGAKARLAWAILIAISASGSLLSMIYTSARVKQVIGISNIMPWSKIWRSPIPSPSQTQLRRRSEFPTPQGGLILHWIFTVILISATSGMDSIAESISFSGNLQAYASGWVGVFISIGFLFLFSRSIPAPTQRRWSNSTEFILFRTWTGKIIFAGLYFAFNAYVIVVPLIGPYITASDTPEEVKGWYYIVIVIVIAMAATVYYYGVLGLAINKYGESASPKRTFLHLAGVYPSIQESEQHEPHYGWRRKLVIHFPSDAVVSGQHEAILWLS
ncbi:amino acid permease-domain-containing protein [Xylogone sp. PMI_703]|nr:amino acid permease-domain-containing protein [Xylogone sp. PMI_703]